MKADTTREDSITKEMYSPNHAGVVCVLLWQLSVTVVICVETDCAVQSWVTQCTSFFRSLMY